MPEPSPHRLERSLRDAYLRYYDTAYWLRSRALRDERRGLLEADGVVFTEPLIEPVLPFGSGPTVGDVCAQVRAVSGQHDLPAPAPDTGRS